MAKFEPVRPGDLIQADFINALLGYVEQLEARIAKLEGQTPQGLRIDSISPDGTIEEHQIVTITGVNFSPQMIDNTVTVAERTITQFKGSSGEKLIEFDMPNIPSITDPAGAVVPITVRNNKSGSSDTKWRRVKNAVVVPIGTGSVRYTQVSVSSADGKLQPGSTAQLIFRLAATASREGTYQLQLNNIAPFTAEIVGPSTVKLPPSQSGEEQAVDVTVKVTVPAAGSATLAVSAQETTTGSQVAITPAPNLTLTVGQDPPSANTGIVLAPGNVSHGKFSEGKLLFSRSFTEGSSAVKLTFSKTGEYEVSFRMKNQTGWTLKSVANDRPSVTSTPVTHSPNAQWAWSSSAADTEMIVTIKLVNATAPLAEYSIPVLLVSTL